MMRAIVVTDLRALPFLTVIYLHKIFKKRDGRTCMIISERIITASDFGHFFPVWYKKLKILFLKVFYHIHIVKRTNKISLSTEDKVGVISSLCSITLDSAASSHKYENLYNGLESLAMGAIEVSQYLESQDVNEVYVFNGRTAASEPIVRFCWQNNVRCLFYEYGLKWGGIFTLYNFPIHNAYQYGVELSNFFKKNVFSVMEIAQSGKNYSDNKMSNVYTRKYREDVLVSYDVAIFLGSDHEYSNLNEEIYGIRLMGNLELCKQAVNKYGGAKKYAVRAHPNQTVDPNYKTALAPIIEFCRENEVDFYGPDSLVSSYELIKNSNLIIVELSSIAVEATILGKQVDIFGRNDLRAILDNCPLEIKNNKFLLSNYVCQVLSLTEKLFHYQLPLGWKIIHYLTFRVDWLIKKVY